MDIKIEAPGHWNQEQLAIYYQDRLKKKYGKYGFIHAIDVKVNQTSDSYRVALQLKPEKGAPLYAKETHKNENSALEAVIRKINTQIEKYKELHYHSSHKFRAARNQME